MITGIYAFHHDQEQALSPEKVQWMLGVASVWWLSFVGLLYRTPFEPHFHPVFTPFQPYSRQERAGTEAAASRWV